MKKVANILRSIIAAPIILILFGIIFIFIMAVLLIASVIYFILGKELVDFLNAKSDQKNREDKINFMFKSS